MPMPWCHILRARLRQQYEGDKSTLPVRDNYSSPTLSEAERVLWIRPGIWQLGCQTCL